jgi:hypothetical protein
MIGGLQSPPGSVQYERQAPTVVTRIDPCVPGKASGRSADFEAEVIPIVIHRLDGKLNDR